MSEGSHMGNYEMDLLRHIVTKAVYESDEIDATEFSHEQIETTMWAVASDVSHGIYLNHPKEMELYEHYESESCTNDSTTGDE